MRTFSAILLFLFSLAADGQISLDTDWQFRVAGSKDWYPAEVPGTVHTDLIRNGLIPDPFFGTNEDSVQWVEKQTWEYRYFFFTPPQPSGWQIIFDGLDTDAEVFLNGKKLLRTNNMFRRWEVPIDNLLPHAANELLVRFLPTAAIAMNQKQNDPISRPDNERVYARKAQYQFDWDWGPRLVTSGIWKPVTLVNRLNPYLGNVKIDAEDITANATDIRIEAEIFSNADTLVRLVGMIWEQQTNRLWPLNEGKLTPVKKGKNIVYLNTVIREPRLWLPGSETAASKYNLDLQLRFDPPDEVHIILEDREQAFGISNIRLVNQPDSIGSAFYFETGGRPFFIKGANWIPSDNFLPRAKKQAHYERLLRAAKEANINMLRVWGGGVYEDDIFYTLCDQYGIMVWQDFMFAGAMYPGDPDFIANVEQEV
ncbi:MAG TPA: hypothetical protein VF145_09210, partial [Chitinophagaceae bacterium]